MLSTSAFNYHEIQIEGGRKRSEIVGGVELVFAEVVLAVKLVESTVDDLDAVLGHGAVRVGRHLANRLHNVLSTHNTCNYGLDCSQRRITTVYS